ncbi:MAG TPA: hypothetical protein VK644_10495 [Chitinophagaceae bacterium]|nr:hypothetical protein [Chitinophagaceae bacterium]
MPIGTFLSQPFTDGIYAAYRPVILQVSATRTDGATTPPVVYCDIYFNDVYYKTLSKTQYAAINGPYSEWQFDIQDAAQEFLKYFLADNGDVDVVEAFPLVVKAQCRVRSSGYDANGFITSENTTPVQGTGSTPPVSGTGYGSNFFYILNATLQNEDNQDLATHLNAFKKRTWSALAWPLTHRPDPYKVCVEDSDIFPILYSGASPLSSLVLNYKYQGQVGFSQAEVELNTVCQPVQIVGSYAMPDGAKDVAYNYFIPLTGTAPFTLEEIVKPGWMTIAIVDDKVVFGGTPMEADVMIDIVISFKVRNCTINLVTYSDNIIVYDDVTCVPVSISGAPVLPNATIGDAYSFSIPLSGNSPFALTDVVKPAWMTITILGAEILFYGTPEEGQGGEDIPVSFTVNNCTGNTVDYDHPIDVLEPEGGGLVEVIMTPGNFRRVIISISEVLACTITIRFDYDWENFITSEFGTRVNETKMMIMGSQHANTIVSGPAENITAVRITAVIPPFCGGQTFHFD